MTENKIQKKDSPTSSTQTVGLEMGNLDKIKYSDVLHGQQQILGQIKAEGSTAVGTANLDGAVTTEANGDVSNNVKPTFGLVDKERPPLYSKIAPPSMRGEPTAGSNDLKRANSTSVRSDNNKRPTSRVIITPPVRVPKSKSRTQKKSNGCCCDFIWLLIICWFLLVQVSDIDTLRKGQVALNQSIAQVKKANEAAAWDATYKIIRLNITDTGILKQLNQTQMQLRNNTAKLEAVSKNQTNLINRVKHLEDQLVDCRKKLNVSAKSEAGAKQQLGQAERNLAGVNLKLHDQTMKVQSLSNQLNLAGWELRESKKTVGALEKNQTLLTQRIKLAELSSAEDGRKLVAITKDKETMSKQLANCTNALNEAQKKLADCEKKLDVSTKNEAGGLTLNMAKSELRESKKTIGALEKNQTHLIQLIKLAELSSAEDRKKIVALTKDNETMNKLLGFYTNALNETQKKLAIVLNNQTFQTAKMNQIQFDLNIYKASFDAAIVTRANETHYIKNLSRTGLIFIDNFKKFGNSTGPAKNQSYLIQELNRTALAFQDNIKKLSDENKKFDTLEVEVTTKVGHLPDLGKGRRRYSSLYYPASSDAEKKAPINLEIHEFFLTMVAVQMLFYTCLVSLGLA